MNPFITGIQQIGIGIPNLHESWKWYRQVFGMRVALFHDKAEAALMIRYTNQKVESRHAVLALNMLGGGGFEIWQYTSKVPQPASFDITLGDLGFYACKMKSRDVLAHHRLLTEQGFKPSPVAQMPDGRPSFWITDPNGNPFQVVEGREWFKETGFPGGGVLGSVIGVSNMEASLKFYSGVLGINEVVFDKTGTFADLEGFENRQYRRVLLRKSQEDNGTFARLLGGIEIELVQWLDDRGEASLKTGAGAIADLSILCFDTIDMKGLKQKATDAGHPFTVDSGDTFGMGEAGGRFAYMEDPDGAWIEMVETHKVPILKKIGWYLKLDDRKRRKPLPNWMVSLLGLNVIKD